MKQRGRRRRGMVLEKGRQEGGLEVSRLLEI